LGDVSWVSLVKILLILDVPGTSCVAVRLWDAHYSPDDCMPLPLNEELLSLGKPERYKRTIQTNTGKLISDVVLQTLTRQERKLGVTGSRYMAEKDHYEEAMNSVFNDLLVRKIVAIILMSYQKDCSNSPSFPL
ncbi:hypothetical protein OS493_037507, partial [Desmophyllum pertusum]